MRTAVLHEAPLIPHHELRPQEMRPYVEAVRWWRLPLAILAALPLVLVLAALVSVAVIVAAFQVLTVKRKIH